MYKHRPGNDIGKYRSVEVPNEIRNPHKNVLLTALCVTFYEDNVKYAVV